MNGTPVDILQRQQLCQPNTVLVGSAIGIGRRSPLTSHSADVVEDREYGIGVAHIDRKQHG
jgi:hypothetical protein